eukprot:XP_001704127.1 Hypothetical protein GL50803_22139 [Giardia lamblia ATCC 50803]
MGSGVSKNTSLLFVMTLNIFEDVMFHRVMRSSMKRYDGKKTIRPSAVDDDI